VEYFENPKLPEELKLIGKYGVFNHLTDLTISPPSETYTSEAVEAPTKAEEAADPHADQGVLSGEAVKRLKRLNGEKLPTCGDCHFWSAFQCQLHPEWVTVTPGEQGLREV